MNKYQVGDVFENIYGRCKIVELLPNKRCLIKWDDYDEICNVTRWNLSCGRFKPKEIPQIRTSIYTKKRMIFKTKENGKSTPMFEIWRSIKKRCGKRANYFDCSISNEWEKDFQAFAEWAAPIYKKGWQIDKDILVKGNKVYSPDTCCFVPKEINYIFTKNNKRRGVNPIGVSYSTKNRLYTAMVSEYGRFVYLGSFRNEIDAFLAYKKEKERYIKEVADKWKHQLEPKVYEALYNYKVEITD